MSTSSTAATSFNGTSTYATQLQQIITHSVAIASLPMNQLQSSQTALKNQQSELGTISSAFSALKATVNALDSSTGTGAFSATVSNSDVLSAGISSGVMAGSYTLNVLSVGSQTNAISSENLTKVTDPSTANINPATSFTLSVNGQSYSISDTAGSLTGLAQAINSSAANVQASVVNVGTSSSPDYRLSIQSLDYAPDSLQLSDGNSNLLSTLSTGTNVSYQVNGQPSTPITSNTRAATISPGLTLQLQQAGTAQVSVSQSVSNMASALASFTNAYNAITSELDKNRGQGGGALSGNSIIFQLQSELRNLTAFSSGSGAVQSLSDLGLSFSDSGSLSFDAAKFSQAASTSPNDLLAFIGTSSSPGFLSAATSMLTGVTDSTTGIISTASDSLSDQISSLGTKITADQAHIAQLQQKLNLQMANVDSTIASLQNQLNEITMLFEQMQTNQRALNG